MKKTLPIALLLALLFGAAYALSAQCNLPEPPGTGPLGCQNAPVLCSTADLDGYCSTTGNTGAGVCPPPFCATCENSHWLAFYAGTSTVSLLITPSNCVGGGGLQAQIFATSDCNNFTAVSNCESPGFATPMPVTATNLNIGQIYYLLIDGFGADICDYTIEVMSGSTNAPSPLITGSISGMTNVCPGASITYSVPTGFGVSDYNWSLTPAIGTISNDGNNTITVDYTAPGTAQLCVTPTNACETGSAICTLIVSTPVPPTFYYTTFCLGDSWTCEGETFYTPGQQQFDYLSWLGCDSTIICIGTAIPPIVMQPELAAICQGDIYGWGGNEYYESGTYTLNLTGANGCDSIVTLILTVLETEAVIAPSDTLDCSGNDTILLDGSGSTTTPDPPSAVLTYAWEGPGIVSGGNTLNPEIDQPGVYILTVTQSYLGTDCIALDSVTVWTEPGPDPPLVEGPVIACLGDTSSYIVTAAGSGSAPNGFTWTVTGGTFTQTGDTITVVWDTIGVVCAFAENDCGTSSATCLEVTINDIPAAPVITGPAIVCNGAVSSYCASADSTATYYNWTAIPPGATLTAGQGTNCITIDWTGASSGDVCVQVGNDCGQSPEVCYAVSVNELPSATLSGGGSICEGSGDCVDLIITFTGTPPWTLELMLDSILLPPINGIMSNPYAWCAYQGGTYEILQVTDSNGCNGLGTGTAEGTLEFAPDLPTVSGPSIACQGATQIYTVAPATTGGAPTGYTWTVTGGAFTITNDSIEVSWDTAGQGEVCVTADNDCGSSTENCLTVEVQGNPMIMPPVEAAVCQWLSYPFAGNTYDSTGIYEVTLESFYGCDSVVTLDLTVLEAQAVIAPPGILNCNSLLMLNGWGSTFFPAAPGAVSYFWIGPGIVSGGNTLTPSVNAPGIYCLTVTQEYLGVECSDQECVVVIQNSEVPEQPTVEGLTAICSGSTAGYSVTPAGTGPEPTGFNWSVTGGTFTANGDSITVTWNTVGEGEVCVSAKNACGSSPPVCMNVEVLASMVMPPVEAAICQGDSYSFAGNDYDTTGVYPIILAAANGCDSLVTLDLTVLEVEAVIALPEVLSCPTDTIVLDGSGSTNVPADTNAVLTYLWTGPGIVDGGNTLSPSIHQPGIYTLTVTHAFLGTACSAQDSTIVSQDLILPFPPLFDGPQVVEQGTNSIYFTSPQPGPEIIAYDWTVTGGTFTPGTDTIEVTWTTIGQGKVCLVVTNECGMMSASVCMQVEVLEPPVAQFTYVQNGAEFTFTDESTGATSWTWDFGDGNTALEQNPAHTYTVDGAYVVSLIVGNGLSSDTTSQTVEIIDVGSYEIEGLKTFSLAPSVSTGLFTLTIELKRPAALELSVVNALGQAVYQFSWPKTAHLQEMIDLSGMAPGAYFVWLSVEGERVVRRMVIIR